MKQLHDCKLNKNLTEVTMEGCTVFYGLVYRFKDGQNYPMCIVFEPNCQTTQKHWTFDSVKSRSNFMVDFFRERRGESKLSVSTALIGE
jgi:hypothetical protein